ncbi:hypothetical protein BZA05DRAFT_420598 [Tricharina praecox]|uniref:uncharacterized protein n=1 Tax=Tricharina praecox TaxID=43433 RepID=UPI00222012CD|nr:uncharacterized protein BZA05DRAFT_420598 [Tricharina praecox]KAI5847545.1 hypothetical protein BZA05DRAFT_420598 [Tricharina praecox]
MSYHASNSGQVWKGKSRWIPHLANPFHAGEGAQQPQHTSADEGAYHSDFDGNFGPAVYNMPPLRSLYTSGQTGEPSSSRRMPAYGEHIGPAGIEGFQQSSLAFRQGMHGKKHYPRIHFFGLNFNHLPPLVTAPSLQNPVAPPLALSLGIDIDWSSGNPAVTFHLIHIERQNGFPPNRQQLFLNLSCPDSKGLPCPSLKYNPHDLHFLAPSSQMISPLQIEALAKLEAEVLVVRTGAVLPNGAQEYPTADGGKR